MKILPFVLTLWTLLGLFGSCQTISSHEFVIPDDSSKIYTYSRFPEIENHCNPYLSSASDLKPDDSMGTRLKNELTFSYGDWEQEDSGAPLMPFDERHSPSESSTRLKSVSFEVKDVNSIHQAKKAVSLIGFLYIGITRNNIDFPQTNSVFHMRIGMSFLKMAFEGVYIESNDNGGERLLCLLGNSTFPSWNRNDGFRDFPYKFDSYYDSKFQLFQDEKIFLVLRYPNAFDLTNREIRGEMRSLNERESFKYFDKVRMYSQLGGNSRYQFSTEKLKSTSCSPYPLAEEVEEDGVNRLTGAAFCNVFEEISSEVYTVEPNWKFGGRIEYPNRFGPFILGKEIKAMELGWRYNNVKLIMQNITCEHETTDKKTKNAKVSAVLRAFPESMEKHIAARRTGLSGMTLSVEGIWNTSTGKLCMVGCTGVVESLDECDSQISLYFPRSFSNRQRSPIFGSISSIRNGTDSYLPLLFEVVMRPTALQSKYRWFKYLISYNYSMAHKASLFRTRIRPSQLVTKIRKSFLKYPSLDRGNLFVSLGLDLLSRDLGIDAYASYLPLEDDHKPEIFVRIEVISLGPLFGRYDPFVYRETYPGSDQIELSNSEVLNISLHLIFTESERKFSEKSYKNISMLFLEGLYVPIVGEMYLIGCRKVMGESLNTGRGLDCSIEVKIEYPCETSRWLFNPTSKITITSSRNGDDPLHFRPIVLHTSVIRYRKHNSDLIFRKEFEGVLRIVMLLVSVAILLSQLLYMKRNVECVPYISRVMLSMQILGYLFPLITNGEILLKSKESKSYRDWPYFFRDHLVVFKILDYGGQFLLFAALLLKARLFQKVSVSRKEKHANSKPRRVPNDKQVLLITFVVITICWFLGFFVPSLSILKDAYTSGDDSLMRLRIMELGEGYVFLVQCLFLLPQIISNWLWDSPVNPLSLIFVYGFSLLRLLLIFYDYLRDPVLGPYMYG